MLKKYLVLIILIFTAASAAFAQTTTSLTLGYPGHWGHLSYTITGATLDAPTGSDPAGGRFVGGRQYKGFLTGNTLTVSGNAISDNTSGGPGSGDYYELVVTVTAGKQNKEYSYIAPKGEKLSKPFSLSVPIDPGATSGGFSIRLIEQNANWGPHGWAVSGSLTKPNSGVVSPAPTPYVSAVPMRKTPTTPTSTVPFIPFHSVKSPARFSRINGQVEVCRAGLDCKDDGNWKIAKLDMDLGYEDHIKTTEDATCVLSFADMSTFVMESESEIIVVEPPNRDSVWRLVAGNIWVNVKKMIKDGTMEIDVNQAVAGIKGTTFTLSTNRSTSTLNVIEGVVAFRSKATGETVMVGGGESVAATSNGLSDKRPIDVSALGREWDAVRSTASANAATTRKPDAAGKPGGSVISMPKPEMPPAALIASQEKTVFDSVNGSGVGNQPTAPATFNFRQPHVITSIMTYHWNDGRGTRAGTIALRDAAGRLFGPWAVAGSPGQGGVPNAVWIATPNVTLPAGEYTIIDSEPSTWSQNSASGNRGMSAVKGYLLLPTHF